ncbi:probable methyltransferase PMT28 [Salvia hispanica]|uniref:probable methyltransferase PMT28 n=1 Tax=Salvia hispanica TaxID=49212 RepID=UPI0020094B35|nr:probable methyltransferase PMT28 [Salvia hispanica]XP_047955466.1 probable methyltransferase PMT28 [Salvia hispanica]
MAIGRLGPQVKRSYQSYGFFVKLSATVVLGLCFVIVWSLFSNYSVTSQRETFDDIAEPVSASNSQLHSDKIVPKMEKKESGEQRFKSGLVLGDKDKKISNGSVPLNLVKKPENGGGGGDAKLSEKDDENKTREGEGSEVEEEEEVIGEKGGNEGSDGEGDANANANDSVEEDANFINAEDLDQEAREEENGGSRRVNRKASGPVFDPKKRYTWKLCNTRSKHNYIPCIDIESATGRLQSYRHRERSCPRSAVMCLVPLPRDGYRTPVRWPESKGKILYKNVEHPKLAAYIKTHDWLVESGDYLTFPQNQSVFKGGVQHYLDSIEEMVPDIELGKNIRIVLDMGCKDSSFTASLLEKGVLALTLGLKDDLVDLAQVALERGFPAVVSPLENRRLPFPSGVFDAIHCGECSISWHSNGATKIILEMNRILRPGGYFILSTKHGSIEAEEALSTLTSSICWNILADKTDELSDIGMKIYQKPEENNIYELRRKKVPPLCKENENPDFAWYAPLKTCLHTVPEAIEQHGAEWPAEWPKRLHTFPEWMNNREKLAADSEHWKSIVNKSYLVGMDIDWSTIRNILDMKAISGGFAAALSDQNVWVMNVVPVHAPDTLPIIFERGLLGVYHDWCESFGSYPRSYDLLHADHLFSRLKNRCKQAVVIIVEMDRLLRPGGWVIIRDKVEILNPLEEILRGLHWEIRMTFAQDREGILTAQKTTWRP